MEQITLDQVRLAESNGYSMDIGQITPQQKRRLDRLVRAGKVLKVKACWPWLIVGTCWKTCYINTQPSMGDAPCTS